MNDNIEQLCNLLRLKRIPKILDRHLKLAQKDTPGYSDFLAALLREEFHDQRERATEGRIRRARLPEMWSLDSFPWDRQPGVDKRAIRELAELDFVRSGTNLVFRGETGVGKDVIANAIHYSSLRSSGPFVSVNCGAIPDSLIDSELFGHEKGAFTGALSQKRGRFERANQGTIFLDEIGELPLQAQVRLLRVLQSKEIERVGGTKTISLDIRIIAATNRNLQEMVTTKQFREDLWFRLDVFPIWIPPLRERKSDIPALLQHFINLKSRELKLPRIPVLAQGAIDPLMKYDWPGNIRELANVVERALITNDDGPLDFKNVQLRGVNLTNTEQNKNPDGLNKVISAHIQQVLAKTNGKVHGPGGAAELLEINPNTLRNRMDKLGIAYGKK
mgnify:CR=1 FL=1